MAVRCSSACATGVAWSRGPACTSSRLWLDLLWPLVMALPPVALSTTAVCTTALRTTTVASTGSGLVRARVGRARARVGRACTSSSRSLACRRTSAAPLNTERIWRSHGPRSASWCRYASASPAASAPPPAAPSAAAPSAAAPSAASPSAASPSAGCSSANSSTARGHMSRRSPAALAASSAIRCGIEGAASATRTHSSEPVCPRRGEAG